MAVDINELRISQTRARWAIRVAVVFVSIAGCCCSANANMVYFDIDGVFVSTAADNPPFTAPNGNLNYSFTLDSDAAFQTSGQDFRLKFADVDVKYSLNGEVNNFRTFVWLSNGEGVGSTILSVKSIDSKSLDFLLDPSIDLWQPIGGNNVILDAEHSSNGFLGADARFDGTLSAQTVPEPSSAMMLLFGGLLATSFRFRRSNSSDRPFRTPI